MFTVLTLDTGESVQYSFNIIHLCKLVWLEMSEGICMYCEVLNVLLYCILCTSAGVRMKLI